jgi:integrase
MTAKKKKEQPRTRGVFERPKGSGIWWIRYTDQWGKLHREKVGPKSLAIDAYRKRKTQVREGVFFPEMIRPKREITFRELADWYLDVPTVKKLRTYDRIRGCLANFNRVFGKRSVKSMRPVDLEKYQDRRENQGAAPATIDMELSVVGTMINKARKNGKVSAKVLEVFRNVDKKLTKGGNVRDRLMTIEEYNKLITGKYVVKWKIRGKAKEEIKDVSPQHLKSLLIVAMHTGMRMGELLPLRWSYIDRENKMIRFPLGLTKEGRRKKIPEDSPLTKNIPVNHHVEKVLNALPRALHHDFVFTYNGLPVKKLRRSFESACKNVGIPYGQKVPGGLRFHDIRATFKTNMLRAGVDKVFRDVILGHSLQGMDARYLKPTDDDLLKAIEKYTEWFDSQMLTDTTTDTREKTRSAHPTNFA